MKKKMSSGEMSKLLAREGNTGNGPVLRRQLPVAVWPSGEGKLVKAEGNVREVVHKLTYMDGLNLNIISPF